MSKETVRTIEQAIALYYEKVEGKLQLKKKYAEDWRERIPKGSLWQPGSPGDPTCKNCLGLGFVTLDVPVNHPAFAEWFRCWCASEERRGAA